VSTLENLLGTYGFLGLFVACAFEGDFSLILAGLLIHLGLFGATETCVVSLAGLITADLTFFWLGRTSSRVELTGGKSAGLLEKAGRLLDRLGPKALPVVRAFYGIRNLTFFLCGRRKWTLVQFLSGDVPGALLWTALLIGLGYIFATSADALFGHVKHIEEVLFVSGTAILIVLFGGKLLRDFIFVANVSPAAKDRAGPSLH
jgi:membrane protein DedA with SNARE-associated domain